MIDSVDVLLLMSTIWGSAYTVSTALTSIKDAIRDLTTALKEDETVTTTVGAEVIERELFKDFTE